MTTLANDREITLPVDEGIVLSANVAVPAGARGVVLFAHGSGSGRHSSRNRYVARALNLADFATMLLDLLTSDEEDAERRTGHLRFDIDLLSERLASATEWLSRDPATRGLPIGYFGASTGAAAALVAAARSPESIRAVVSRGGRPDLAFSELGGVKAPTLLIVGELDFAVLDMNRRAIRRISAEKALEIVPAATHLFEEPGALDSVAELSAAWFTRHLAASERARTEENRPWL